MFISRMHIDTTSRNGGRYLRNPNLIHGNVNRILTTSSHPKPDGGNRPLWRVDLERHSGALYIVSVNRPDLDAAQQEWGLEGRVPECHSYDRRLDSLAAGQEWSFRLTANPVRGVDITNEEGDTARKRVAHTGPKFLREWLETRGDRHGFSIPVSSEGFPSMLSTPMQKRVFTKSGAREGVGKGDIITLGAVTFTGRLRIKDTEKFRDALTLGIGRSKAYGCGLMTIAPAPICSD